MIEIEDFDDFKAKLDTIQDRIAGYKIQFGTEVSTATKQDYKIGLLSLLSELEKINARTNDRTFLEMSERLTESINTILKDNFPA